MSYEELKNKILEYRVDNNLTQLQMAKELGISEGTLIDFMKGRYIKEVTKIKIEKKFKEMEK